MSASTTTAKKPRTVNGSDWIVLLQGPELTPLLEEMDCRWTPSDMEEMFPDLQQAWLVNKNLCRSNRRGTGGIVYLPQFNIVALVLIMTGPRGLVQQVYPKDNAGKLFGIDNRMDGFYLEQVYGPLLIPLECKSRGKKQIDRCGCVVPPVDQRGFLKMDYRGPDIAVLPRFKVPEHLIEWFRQDPFTRTKPKINKEPQSSAMVPTWYVYRKAEQHDIKFVARYQVGKKKYPMGGIPLGGEADAKDGTKE